MGDIQKKSKSKRRGFDFSVFNYFSIAQNINDKNIVIDIASVCEQMK